MAQRFRTDLKDEIVQGGMKFWRAVNASGTILMNTFKMERTNTNTQDGDNFGAMEVNKIHAFLNGVLDGTEKIPWSGVSNKPTTYAPIVGEVANTAYDGAKGKATKDALDKVLAGTTRVPNSTNATNVTWGGVTNKPSTFPPVVHKHGKVDISDFPTSMPANGGNALTVGGYKVSYTSVVVNAGSGNVVKIPYPSGMKKFCDAHPVNSNMDANYSYIQAWASRTDGLYVRLNNENGNNIQLNILWVYQ